ncbi:MAG: T9SS type A sorting domain-containing protein, partial [Bacteroidota bacterium]|nr:T9SS type A sorting domain-containing protein [Bacteroidota bacterium]
SVAVDYAGNMYIADQDNNRVRKVSTNGIITTISGDGTAGFSGDGGPATAAELNSPANVAVDALGNLYIADQGNNRVRKIDANGIITTVAGNGNSNSIGDGGKAINAGLGVSSVTVDSLGNILIADGMNQLIRKVDKTGIITTIAGGGNSYGDGDLAIAAQLQGVTSIGIDASGSLYIPDITNHRLRKVSSNVLPVTLTNFTAQQKGSNAVINWQASNEVNLSRFAIQRSLDANTFTSIGSVPAVGNKNYTYTDTGITQLTVKTIYYRLLMIDRDGKKAYSKIADIDLSQQVLPISVFPNPVKQLLYVKGKDIKGVTILNLEGKAVINQATSSDLSVVNIANLPKGIYIVKAYNANRILYTEKILKE